MPNNSRTSATTAAGKTVKGKSPATAPARPKANADAARRMPTSNGEGNPSGENLEKVRDILFGSQMRDQDKRFGRLEERVAKELSDLREESRRRIESLEGTIKKELQAVADRLKSEQTLRGEAVKELAQDLKAAGKEWEKRLSDSDDQHSQTAREIRQEILDQAKLLRDEMRHGLAELTLALERGVAVLRAEKADRAALSDMFGEMALRLNADAE